MGNMITTDQLVYQYRSNEKEVTALNEVSLNIDKGEFVVIIGHNGSGKSTFAKHLNALLLPTSGDVIVKGLNTKDEERVWEIRQTAGMVFQNPDNQIVATIVEEDVAFGPENLGIPSEEILKRVEEALKSVDMLDFREKAPHMLSGGQKQRIMIARAIIKKPKIIFFDEATSALDNETQAIVSKSLDQLQATRIVIAHRLSTIKNCNKIIVMDKGSIVERGTYQELMDKEGIFASLAKRQLT